MPSTMGKTRHDTQVVVGKQDVIIFLPVCVCGFFYFLTVKNPHAQNHFSPPSRPNAARRDPHWAERFCPSRWEEQKPLSWRFFRHDAARTAPLGGGESGRKKKRKKKPPPHTQKETCLCFCADSKNKGQLFVLTHLREYMVVVDTFKIYNFVHDFLFIKTVQLQLHLKSRIHPNGIGI